MTFSNSTSRLNLPQWQPTDPYDVRDFNGALEAIDEHPGVFICTSTTRPSWGPPQAGMFISETDTERLLQWTGTAWALPTNAGISGFRAVYSNTSFSANNGIGSAVPFPGLFNYFATINVGAPVVVPRAGMIAKLTMTASIKNNAPDPFFRCASIPLIQGLNGPIPGIGYPNLSIPGTTWADGSWVAPTTCLYFTGVPAGPQQLQWQVVAPPHVNKNNSSFTMVNCFINFELLDAGNEI